jgi:hypothetical protein
MKRKIAIILIVILLLTSVSATLAVFAVSYPPPLLYHRLDRGETVMKAGQTVYLFHSGTDDVRKTIHADDILTTYRTIPSCEVNPIGIIKVLSYIGETYIKAEVLEGEIRPDDIAKKGNVSCLVILAGMCNP